MWSAAKLASVWSSMGSTDGLALWLLYVAAMGEMLAGLLLREASPSFILAWEEVSTDRSGASDLWDGDVTVSTVAAFPMGGCSNLWLDSSTIAQVSRSSTSVAMLIHGFKGVLGELAAGIVCASPTGRVVCSGSFGESRGILILMYGCSFAVMLALLCSSSGKVMGTGSSFLFKPTR